MSNPETPERATVERFQVAGKMDEIAIYSHDGDADWVFDFDALREFVGTESTLVREADYLTLHAQLTALQDAVKAVKTGECWCQFGIGNPMYGGHTTSCGRLRALVDPSSQEQP